MKWVFNIIKIIFIINDLYAISMRETKIITTYILYLYLIIQMNSVIPHTRIFLTTCLNKANW